MVKAGWLIEKMRTDNIEMAIAIVVADRGTHARHFHALVIESKSALESFLTECAVVIVHQQQAGRGVAGHEYIGPSVLIHIEGHCGKAIGTANSRNPRFLRDIRERAISIIAIQRMGRHREA